VLYLHIGERQSAADSEQTPEGHVLRLDDAGKIIGLTIINAKWLLERDRRADRDAARAGSRRGRRDRGRIRRGRIVSTGPLAALSVGARRLRCADGLTTRRSLVRAQYRPSTKCLQLTVFGTRGVRASETGDGNDGRERGRLRAYA
jgi:uncharacterized protein YuzE